MKTIVTLLVLMTGCIIFVGVPEPSPYLIYKKEIWFTAIIIPPVVGLFAIIVSFAVVEGGKYASYMLSVFGLTAAISFIIALGRYGWLPAIIFGIAPIIGALCWIGLIMISITIVRSVNPTRAS